VIKLHCDCPFCCFEVINLSADGLKLDEYFVIENKNPSIINEGLLFSRLSLWSA